MAIRTKHNIKCSCGHVGHIAQVENDQPYAENWDSYTPVNLKGSAMKYSKATDWPKIFNDMKIACEACDRTLDATNLE